MVHCGCGSHQNHQHNRASARECQARWRGHKLSGGAGGPPISMQATAPALRWRYRSMAATQFSASSPLGSCS
eukprot:9502679-Pyramimonas_sp.AAC.2